MTKTTKQIWKMFEDICRDMNNQDSRIVFHPEQEENFSNKFHELYDLIVKKCMDVEKGTNTLDRHKVTAIIVISGIESGFVSLDKELGKERFLGKEIISLSVALSFLQAVLNTELEHVGAKKISKFEFPKALTCKTDYFDIMVRNLYYSQEYWQMNPLELAEKFFLIEVITLEKNGIDLSILREVNKMES